MGLLNADDNIAWMSIAHDILNQPITENLDGQHVKQQSGSSSDGRGVGKSHKTRACDR